MKNYWISILSSIVLLTSWGFALAQSTKEPKYLFPVRPGQTNYLAGSMGEIRGTHFHAGIDIKVGGTTGWPIYAVADGFVNRIKVSTSGYGNALYLQHSDGNTTLYGHLLKYEEKLQEYIRKNQYKQESFEIELTPEKDLLKYKKGDIIGYAGNSGSSQGPHLHFEIRDSRQHVLDPLKFGFKEVTDDLAPIVSKIALRTIDIDSRINGGWGTFVFEVDLVNSVYIIKDSIHIEGNVGVAIYAYDRMNGVPNRNGIPCAELTMDDRLLFQQNITSLDFAEMRNVVVHIDYPLLNSTGNRFNKLYVDHGNDLHFLKNQPGPGTISITDTLTHLIQIKLTDSFDNSRLVRFTSSPVSKSNTAKKQLGDLKNVAFDIAKNTMEMMAAIQGKQPSHITLYANRMSYDISPAYTNATQAFYLWDLRQGLPDSVDLCGKMINPAFLATIPQKSDFNYYHNSFNIHFSQSDLFDTLHLRFEKKGERGKEVFQFYNQSTPLRTTADIILKPTGKYLQPKTHVYTLGNRGELGYVGGKWSGSNIHFSARELGRFTLATDTIPPEIRIIKSTPQEIRATISDNLSGIKTYRAEIDGKWVLMNYDYKQRLLWSEKLEPNIPFAGELLIKVADNANNEKTYKSKI